MLSIALPTGRMCEQACRRLSAAGYDCRGITGPNRKLIFEDRERRLRYLLVKPRDVAMYVAHGAADIGVAGRDVILESEPDILELLDLGFGRCRLAVAAKKGWHDHTDRLLRVATAFPHVAEEYFLRQGRQIELIRLHGSVELAPLINLSDVIVDVVETGATLQQNNMEIIAEIAVSSARLIANKSSYHFNLAQINQICKELEAAL
ncbi:MAG: ATP phosphoribosyltransferase [Clostridia bacterium]|nr:ATP phosphoribosyltransferase [Clostridia bacterium]